MRLMTICILSGITILSASCSTTHKNRSSRATSVDSTASVVNRQTNVSKDQTTISQQNDIQKTGNIKLTLIYDTGKVQINTVLLPTGNEDKSAINRVINALTNERLRRAEIEGNFNLADKSKIVTNNNKSDSISQHRDSSAHVIKTEEAKTMQKEVKGINIWVAIFGSLWFWLIIAAIAAIIFLKHKLSVMNILKKIWPFILVILLFSCNKPDSEQAVFMFKSII